MVEDFGQVLAQSADRRHVVGWMPETDVIRLADTQTGQCAGELHTGARISGVLAAAMSDDQKGFAAAVEQEGTQLAIWDLGDGTLVDMFPISNKLCEPVESLLWVDPAYLLVGERYLVGTKNHTVAWQHFLSEGLVAGGSPDGRCWYCFAGGGASP